MSVPLAAHVCVINEFILIRALVASLIGFGYYVTKLRSPDHIESLATLWPYNLALTRLQEKICFLRIDEYSSRIRGF